jgi:hypothetical protein
MGERRCRYCQQVFQLSKFQPRQAVCSGAECQRKRRTDYHREKIATDREYREVCRDSPRNGAPAIPVTGNNTAKSARRLPSTIASSRSSGTGSGDCAILPTTPQLWT